jgi:DNA-directed RNA polymerase subunit M/transcription elongation factor TFIIS
MTFFLIYIATGILLNLAGPLACQIRHEMKDLRSQTEVVSTRKKLLIAEIIFRTLTLLFFPVAYMLWAIDLFRAINENKERSLRQGKIREEIRKDQEKIKWDIIQNRSFIYFNDTHGGGTIKCHGCGHSEEIISYSHGFKEPLPFTRGFQCQNCGRFHKIQFLGSRMITPYLRCSCGGELSNTKPIFCPRCKARDVFYRCEYVT